MKATGIVRKVDELGRIVIPIELRRKLGVDIKDPVEIYTEGDMIILKKHEPSCIFCGEQEALSEYKEKIICAGCIEKMKK